MAEWEIRKPLGECSGTGRKIEVGEEYYAALVQTDEGLQRRDFTSEYWGQHSPEVYCYWKSRLPSSEEKKKLFIDDDMLLAFFERLGVDQEQGRVDLRFVVGLILMRKRLLKYESSQDRDGAEVWTLRLAGSADRVEMVNPHLGEDKIEELSSQVGEILQVGDIV